MISINERQNDILRLVSQLDITPTMYNNAVEKYTAIAGFLAECGITADMYPQGSFAFGTVVRPNTKDPDASYDLDFICQVKMKRSDITPSKLRQMIENALRSSDRYKGKLDVYDECFTIQYADVNGVGFTIDIVPAADETDENKLNLMNKSQYPNLLSTAIVIPRCDEHKSYSWITNNPKGFRTWFDSINQPFLIARKSEIRQSIFEANRHLYASVEEVPNALERSSMQRVIQILKFHRNIYYSKVHDGDDLKPISAIINKLVAEISQLVNPTTDTFSLLYCVLSELDCYSNHLYLSNESFLSSYGSRAAITHAGNRWFIANPADPADNLANKWNEDPRIPEIFFKWIKTCKEDLLASMDLPDDRFYTTLANAFGPNTVQKTLGTKYPHSLPKPIIPASASKPYRTE